jgi:hypothetical protein
MRCLICGADHSKCGGPAAKETMINSQVIRGANKRMNSTMWTSPRRIYLDASGNVVDDTSPAKATLLVAEGGTIPLDQAVSLGLAEVMQEQEVADVEPKPAKAKAVKAAANKAVEPAQDK